MRSIFNSVILAFCFILSGSAMAQTSITSIKTNGDKTELTITSSEKFYVGGNTHVLHIGKKEFSLNKQANTESKGTIIFYIPTAEFNALTEGEEVFMTYGTKVHAAQLEITPAEFCKMNPKTCWYLGKFTKTL